MRVSLPSRLLCRRLSTTTTRPLAARIPVPTTATTTTAPTPTSHLKTVATTALTPPTTPPCSCDPTGLDIDRDTPLLGTMPRYGSHIVVSTGRDDWTSRIEFDVNGVAGVLKGLLRQGDPWRPSMVTNSSVPPATPPPAEGKPVAEGGVGEGSIHIFPAGYYIPRLPLPPGPAALGLLTSPGTSTGTSDIPIHRVLTPTILICSHHTRDARCGAYFPPLAAEFRRVLRERGVEASVAGSSHLGGHKWAGNVVVYLPGGEGEDGWGVWYGRVGVREVQAIVDETVVGRRVVEGICRGVVGRAIESAETVGTAEK